MILYTDRVRIASGKSRPDGEHGRTRWTITRAFHRIERMIVNNLRGGRLPLATASLFLFVSLLAAGCNGRKPGIAAMPQARERAPLLRSETRADQRIADNTETPVRAEVLPVAIDVALQSTPLKAGQKLSGTVSGKLEKGAYAILWLDGPARIVCAFQIDSAVHAKNKNETTFDIQQPPALINAEQQVLVVRVLNERTDAKGQYELCGQAGFHVANDSASWTDYAVLTPNSQSPKIGLSVIADAIPQATHPLMPPSDWSSTVGAYAKSRSSKGLERNPALFDERVLSSVQAAINENVCAHAVSPTAWSLGDGISLTQGSAPFDMDTSPASLAIFRGWLEDRYTSLENLNVRWNTSFRRWEDVVPPSTDSVKSAHSHFYRDNMAALLEQNRPGAAVPAKSNAPPFKEVEGTSGFAFKSDQLRVPGGESFSAWCDAREFSDFAFARMLREYHATLLQASGRQGLKAAPAGISGACGPAAFGGWDWWQLSKSVDWAHSDAPLVPELLRSFAPLTGMGVKSISTLDLSDEKARLKMWDRWLSGDSGITVAKPATKTPDAAALEDARGVLRALTLLRNESESSSDAIALYYSPRSLQIQWMLDSEADGSYWLQRDSMNTQKNSGILQLTAWHMLLQDLGYCPRFVHPQQLLAGHLRRTKTKVLVLPKVVSLSQDETKAIRDFARAGGIVIADGACGTFDGYANRSVATAQMQNEPRAFGALDKEFGVARKDLRVSETHGAYSGDVRARISLKESASDSVFGPSSPELRVLEPGLVAAGATPYGWSATGTPALLGHNAGSGRFMYLNLALQDYPELRCSGDAAEFSFQGIAARDYAEKYGPPTGGEALRLVIGDIFSEALGECRVSVRHPGGTPLKGLRRTRLMLGLGTIVALLPTGFGNTNLEKISTTVGLASRHHWYDVLEGTYLGEGQSVAAAVHPDRATVLSALPYKVAHLSVKIRRTDSDGTFKIAASLLAKKAQLGKHAFRIEVFDSKGNPLKHYDRFVVADGGAWKGEIHLAMNEPAGRCRIQIRDVLTGMKGEGTLEKESSDFTTLFTNR